MTEISQTILSYMLVSLLIISQMMPPKIVPNELLIKPLDSYSVNLLWGKKKY